MTAGDRAEVLIADTRRSVASLTATLDGISGAPWPAAWARVDRPVRFVGLGSSRFAAMDVAAALADGGRVARAEPATTEPAPPLDGELVVAVSASGRTPEVVESARRLAGSCEVIAVTNDAGSPLAALGRVVELRAGVEAAGIATLTYRATIAALALVTSAAYAADLRATTPAIEAALADEATVQRLVEHLDGAPSVDVVGDDRRLGSAEQAALMLREAPRLRAVAWGATEWAHTAIYTALPGHRVLVVGASGTHDREGLETVVTGRGGGVADVLPPLPPDASPLARAIVLSVVVELVAARLWLRARGQTASPNAAPFGR